MLHTPTSRWPLAPLAAALLIGLGVLAGCQKDAAPGAAPGGAPANTSGNTSGNAPSKGAPPAPTAVGVDTLQAGKVSLSTELPGRVSAPQQAEVRPQVRGLVKTRNFSEGELVKAGQVLYQIESDAYRIALASAQASVAKAQATLEAAKLTAQRRAELLKIDGVSQQDVQDAQVAVKQAEADLASARATQDSAQLNLSRTAVTAPISGRVDVSSVTPGALVTADQTTALTTVRQLDPIQVDVSQSSAELLRLKRELASGKLKRVGGEAAQIKLLLEDGSTYPLPGKLSFAGVAVNTSTGAVTLRAQFPNPEGVLLPGMYVRAVLETGVVEQGLVVPQQAVQRDSRGGASVLLVDAQNKVQKRPVTVSRAFGNGWLVSDGLQAGERVIVEGGQKVKPGEQVQVHDANRASAAPAVAAASAASR